MDKDKIKNFGKMPNRPYAIWLILLAVITVLVMFPKGTATNVQNFDIRRLMGAASSDELVELTLRNDPTAGKDWYNVDGKVKNPLFGTDGAPKDTPRTLSFSFSGRITDEAYKKLSDPSAPWTLREVAAGSFWGNLLSSILPVLIIVGVLYFLFTRQMRAAGRGARGAPAAYPVYIWKRSPTFTTIF